MMKMKWTPEQWATAQRMRAEGKTNHQIAAALHMTWRQIKNRFYHKSLSREELDAKNALERENRSVNRGIVNKTYKAPYAWPAPPADALAERNDRLATPPRDLTAALCGDPRPGWSALERRGAC